MNRKNKHWKPLLVAFALSSFGCSSPIKKPNFGSKTAKNNSGVSAGNSADSAQMPSLPRIDPQSLRETAEEILAPAGKPCTQPEEAPNPILRPLTKVEFNNTVHDLFGLTADYADDIPTEIRVMFFKNNADSNYVSDSHMDAYMRVAKTIAEDIVSTKFQPISGCSVSSGEACANAIITKLGPRIWRRPVTPEEAGQLLAIFKVGEEASPETGFQMLFRAFLSSPYFTYRNEIGSAGSLSPHEIAHVLSYFFWASVPDDELRALADSREITKPLVLLAQAKRLMASPKAKTGIREIVDGLMGYTRVETVGKSQQKFPAFTTNIRKAMIAETEDSFDYWIRSKNGKFQDLFTANYTVGSSELAAFYQAKLSQDNGTQIINFEDSKRRGLLGLGALLSGFAAADETNPIKRGKLVREQLLCEILPLPDGDIAPLPVNPGLSTRERFAQHSKDPACRSCHLRIDGIGFGMEDFDAVGLYRDQENGKPLDASGEVVGIDGRDSNSFNGVEGLSNLLKDSERAKRCLVLQTFREAAGRFETKGDVCNLRAIADDFIQKDSTISEMLINLITNGKIMQRKVP